MDVTSELEAIIDAPSVDSMFRRRLLELLIDIVDDFAPISLELNGLVLDQARQEVTVNGKVRHLTPKECRLLATFMQHPGEILNREFLIQEVWETGVADDTRTIEVHVSWLRRKIEKDSSNPQLIRTVRGKGYVLLQK